MKLGIVSPSFRASDMGQSIVLQKLLKTFDLGEYCLIASQYYGKFKADDSSDWFKTIYYPFSFPQRIQKMLLQLHFESFYISYRTWQFVTIFKKERCTDIIGCTSDLFACYAAFIASTRLKIPFTLYSFDDLLDQWAFDQVYLNFAQKIEGTIINGSKNVIVPNEFLQQEYARRFGIQSKIIHNPVDTSLFGRQIPRPVGRPIKIVYTGSIYSVHYDAFHSLIKGINQMTDVELHIFTAQKFDTLSKAGIYGPNVILHSPVPNSEIPDIFADADILYLPLAFNSPYPDSTIKTASPGKMGEYLASGRPILVNAPNDSYISWYFRSHHCGVVVDDQSPELLIQGIQEAIINPELVKFNKELAKKDFDINTQRMIFKDLFS